VPYLGVVFFIWVGIFSLASIAQFWSYANDVYDRPTGDRLFAMIGIGATVGSWAGSKIAELLFKAT
jgi:AAA family ATP:ADP antiporter